MSAGDRSAREALIQYVQTDQLLGLKEIPLRLPARGAARRPGVSTAPAAKPAAATGDKAPRLRVLDDGQVKSCTKCGLSATRTKTVFGQGSPDARLVFVGEGPGFEEDRQGLAFVGRAGELLTKMIVAMGLTRDEVYICNIVKCRPPNNRDPANDEIAACSSYLYEQLGIIQPEVIVALGSPATKTLLRTPQSIGRLRGQFHQFYPSGFDGVGDAIPLMPTYHPAYLLRTPSDKGKTWSDLQAVMKLLGLPLPQTRP